MLNAGLSTLDYLKSRILPEAGREETQWDAALSTLGLAVTRRMEAFCNRRLERVTAAVAFATARTTAVSLKCYPVEEIASVELLEFSAATTPVTDGWRLDQASGLVEFATVPGAPGSELKITYTGGYWLDPLDESETLPDGATALPADLLEAWVAECQAQAEARGIFDAVSLRSQKEKTSKGIAGLSADTLEALIPYRRFAGE